MRRRVRRPGNPPIEEVAAVTQRLAVLLAAGVSPVSAWGYLLPQPDEPEPHPLVPASGARSLDRALRPRDASSETVLRAAALAGPRGESVADAIARAAGSLGGYSRAAWLGLAAAWAVATAAGSPMAGCLRQLAASFRDAGQLQRDLQVALAGPAATSRLVMALPVVGVVFGALMGFDTLSTLFATMPGLMCLTAGAILMLVAHRWNARLVRKAQPTDAAPGLELELTAIAMAGGGSIDRARALVRAAEARYGLDEPKPGDAVERILDLSARAGVPAVELLLSEADQERRDARSVGQRKAATLGVTLMLPLGLCVLPAFMLLGVAPLLLSVVSSTFGTL
jgi:tight adherence protein B